MTELKKESLKQKIVATYRQLCNVKATHQALGRLCSLEIHPKAAYALKKVARAVEQACDEIASEWKKACAEKGYTFDKEGQLDKGTKTEEEYAEYRKGFKEFERAFQAKTKDIGLHKFPFIWFEQNKVDISATEIDSLDWLYYEPEADDEEPKGKGKLKSV